MKKFSGDTTDKTITIGVAKVIHSEYAEASSELFLNADEETVRFEHAIESVLEESRLISNGAEDKLGNTVTDILEAEQILLKDASLIAEIKEYIRDNKTSAEKAILSVCGIHASKLESVDDEYIRARAEDIKNVAEYLVEVMQENNIQIADDTTDYVLICDTLSPRTLLKTKSDYLRGIVMKKGSLLSHASIIAKEMGIPVFTNINFDGYEVCDGQTIILDGINNLVLLNPDDETYNFYINEKEKVDIATADLFKNRFLDAKTKNGKHIKVYANIGSSKECQTALENGGEGIGLYRTEFLFINRNEEPSEEEQFEEYKFAAEQMDGREVIIRTLDIGADKSAEYLKLPKEENPAMGLRGIRLCLAREDMFMRQLRAIFRAAYYGNISIMYPMISSESEVDKIQKIVEKVIYDLTKCGESFVIPKQGVMIETPSAVMISEILAKKVDFFSIGTNDLTQYALAVDRQNSEVDMYFDSLHPAIIKMIDITVKNAHKYGKEVSLCGELGAKESATELLVNLGIDKISVSPGKIMSIKEAIRKC